MKALQYSVQHVHGIVDVTAPKPGAVEVRPAVQRIGVCCTNMHVLRGTIPLGYPIISCHEVVVTAASDSVTAPVGAGAIPPRPGNPCDAIGEVSVELAAFAETVVCVLYGVHVALRAEDSARVIGAGPFVLMMMVQAPRNAGVATVTVAVQASLKLDPATLMGTDKFKVLEREGHDGSIDHLRSHSGDRGFDLVFDPTGSPKVGERTLATTVRFGSIIRSFAHSLAVTVAHLAAGRIDPLPRLKRDTLHKAVTDLRD